LDLSGLWQQRRQLVSGCFGVVVWRVFVRWILEEIGNFGCSWWVASFVSDDHDHPVYAEWLGRLGRRIPCDDRDRSISHERVLLAVSFYLLKQDVIRARLTSEPGLSRDEAAQTVREAGH
jgi:hypothetical protein